MTTNSPAAAGVRSAGSRLAIMAAVTATIVAIGWLGLRLVPGLYDGIWSFVLDGQREMTKGMTEALRQLKTLGSVNAALILGFISFIYGVLHAVGPGHGKFVISSYALANERTVRRGILLSFMAALIQALSAIVLVGILAMILKATSLQIKAAENWLETASWGLIALLGAWLLWTRLRGDHHHHHAGHAAGEPHHPQPDHGHAHGAHAHDACCAGGHHHDATTTHTGPRARTTTSQATSMTSTAVTRTWQPRSSFRDPGAGRTRGRWRSRSASVRAPARSACCC